MRFQSREQAGQELAVRLLEWASSGDLANVTVLALPRGGVPVGAEIARVMRVPMDVLVVRKIGVPGSPEVGVGAIVGDDPPVFDRTGLRIMDLSEDELGSEVARERVELRRREQVYRGGRPAPDVRGHSVVVVDDGLATGITARAALRHVRRREPLRLTLAVPVCGHETAAALRDEADDVVSLHQPQHLRSVGEWYADFHQVSDQEVLKALRQLHPAG
ncbi:phosphoribosyltransferase [Streptomyces griseoloalbus]|uniref:Putative phosphoribosyltransferase n=1 Tax=Streptomyces griseoloalbus TaxID=67303 RepID=A0A7W8FAL4_9ACTN|nr:phosphoribosyltransferase family protein [Streptomyces albaduncus]MBB5128297.1 putative phosphoribosyltransferase [Streptomyces albaduncus]GGV86430.1 phosphoribosyltransferase [Streptomyces griseoloalbus]GGW54550.1 phosphoribosyltransferase [Streptomyces albaduncus]